MKIVVTYSFLPFIGQIDKNKNEVSYNVNPIILKSKYNKPYTLIQYIHQDSHPSIIINYFNDEEDKRNNISFNKLERKNESLLHRYITNLVNLLY